MFARRLRWMIVVGLALGPSACGPQPPAVDTENLLVLELGGAYESLAESLRASAPVAAEPAAPERPPQPGGEAGRAPESERRREPETEPEREREPEPGHRREREPRQEGGGEAATAFRIVRLRADQTLYRLCEEQFGSGGGARWREVARLNGWSEADVRRLPANQPVRLPAAR